MAVCLQHLSLREVARTARSTDLLAEELPAEALLEVLVVLPVRMAGKILGIYYPQSALKRISRAERALAERQFSTWCSERSLHNEKEDDGSCFWIPLHGCKRF